MDLKGKRILHVSSDFPYPPNFGGRIDVWRRIQVIKKLGYEIDLICTVKTRPPQEDIEVVKSYVEDIIFVDRVNKVSDLISINPHQIKSRTDLKNVKVNKSYDLMLLESQYVFPIMENSSISATHVVLRLHNNEPDYLLGLAQSEHNVLKKMYYYMESRKFLLFDKHVFDKVKRVLFISKDEMHEYQKKYTDLQGVFLPPSANSLDMKRQKLQSNKVLFIGSFFMTNNQESVVWYMNNVHNRLTHLQGYEVIFAGYTRGENMDWLDPYRAVEQVKIYESPKDIDHLYACSSVFINPMRHGAGVKLKTVDAIINGLPVVSSTIGNQGTGLQNGRHIFVEDKPEEFANRIIDLLKNKTLAQSFVEESQIYLEKTFNQEKILSEVLHDLMK